MPKQLSTEYINIIEDTKLIKCVSFARWILSDDVEFGSSEIHVFLDASINAYGALIYLRFRTYRTGYQCRLIRSKAKVVPRKGLTVPKLELAAALVGVNLYEVLRNSISEFQNIPITF